MTYSMLLGLLETKAVKKIKSIINKKHFTDVLSSIFLCESHNFKHFELILNRLFGEKLIIGLKTEYSRLFGSETDYL
jgi:hypothetical protein